MNLRRRFVWRRGEDTADLTVESRDGRRVAVRNGGEETIADFARLSDGRSSVILPTGRQMTGRATARPDGRVEAWVGARRVHVELADPLTTLARGSAQSSGGAREVRALIPGRVVEVRVAAGDPISVGSTLLVLEAMKMQNEIRSDFAGRVAKVDCAPGQTVETGVLLVRVEADPVG